MPNLSLLSCGIGQVVKKDQEKLEVHYEPEDYFNWKSHESYSHFSKTLNAKHITKDCLGLSLPRTYSRRTGALVLRSENLAKPSWKKGGRRMGLQGHRHRSKLQMELHTLQDLTRATLAHGRKQGTSTIHCRVLEIITPSHPYLHFLNKSDNQIDRQICPGCSSKRYLFRLSQTWDRGITDRLQCAECISNPLLLQEYSGLYEKTLQDLSAVPEKYHFLLVPPSFCKELSQQIHLSKQGYVKSQDVKVKGLNENSFFPPIPSATSSEQDVVMDEHRKPETSGHENSLAPALHDLISGPEGTAKQHQMAIGGYPDIHQGSFTQSQTGNQEFALEERKAEARRMNASMKGHYKKGKPKEKRATGKERTHAEKAQGRARRLEADRRLSLTQRIRGCLLTRLNLSGDAPPPTERGSSAQKRQGSGAGSRALRGGRARLSPAEAAGSAQPPARPSRFPLRRGQQKPRLPDRKSEQQKWKKKEQQEEMEKVKADLEKEQQRSMEEMHLQKPEEWRRQEEEATKKSQLEKAAQEHISEQQEDYNRKLLQFQEKRQLEEREGAEAEKHRQKEGAMWLEEERQQLMEMAEERLEYERRNWEKTRYEAEEQKKNAGLALEEAKTQAQLLIRQRADLEQHLQFQRALLIEATRLEHTLDVPHPWVLSCFQLLEKLGLKTIQKE
ncbi:LOW QUALITY PROTEIN: uncharacterized protein KIAA2012 homolog [Sarcoramphus papa]